MAGHRFPDDLVVKVDVVEKEVFAVLASNGEIDDMNGNRSFEEDGGGAVARQDLLDLIGAVVSAGVLQQNVHKIKRLLHPHTSGAEDPVAVAEEFFVVRIVKVDGVFVGKHKLDPPQGIGFAGELDEAVGDGAPVVLVAEELLKIELHLRSVGFVGGEDVDIVLAEILRVFFQHRDEVPADEVVWDRPGGVEHHIGHPAIEDRGRAVDAADDDIAFEKGLIVAIKTHFVFGDIDFHIDRFPSVGVEFEFFDVDDDFAEVFTARGVEVVDHLVVDALSRRELEASTKAANRLGQSPIEHRIDGAAGGVVSEKHQHPFDLGNAVVTVTDLQPAPFVQPRKVGHPAVFVQDGDEVAVAPLEREALPKVTAQAPALDDFQ